MTEEKIFYDQSPRMNVAGPGWDLSSDQLDAHPIEPPWPPCSIWALCHPPQSFSHMAMVSGCGRELNAHF